MRLLAVLLMVAATPTMAADGLTDQQARLARQIGAAVGLTKRCPRSCCGRSRAKGRA